MTGGPVADDWEHMLLYDERRRLKNLLANVYAILAGSPAWSGMIAFNEARGEIELVGPGPHVDHAEGQPWVSRSWTDTDDTLAAIWLQRYYAISVKPETVAVAVAAIAARRPFNPLTRAIEAVTWDQVPRLATWLIRYAGADDTPFVRAVGAAWLRCAVARAFAPGIKADAALILEGPQGAGKSSLFAVIGGAFFLDELRDLDAKDTKIALGRAWIVELAELSALSRAEVEATKAFLSRRSDNYRPVWGRRAVDVPRRCAFGGSTNRSDYLRDETGGRRFWPVRVEAVDLEALRRDRDQLLAEALVSWRAGGALELPVDLRAVQHEEAEARRQADAWEEVVRDYLQNRTSTSVGEVLTDAIGLSKEKWGRSEQMRAAGVLVALGWTRRRQRLGGALVWRYVPLPTPPPKPPPDPNESGGVPNGEENTPRESSGVPNVPNVPSVGAPPVNSSSSPSSSSCSLLDDRNVRNNRNTGETKGSGGPNPPFPTPPPVGSTWAQVYAEARAAGHSDARARAFADFEVPAPAPAEAP